MKKFFILLTATLISVGMYATPVTWDNTFCGNVQAYNNFGTAKNENNSAGTMLVEYADRGGLGTDGFGFNGGNIQLTSLGGKLIFSAVDHIRKIVIYCNSASGAPQNSRLSEGWSWDGTAKTLTWVGATQQEEVDLYYITGTMWVTVDHIVFMNNDDYEEEQALLPVVTWDNPICTAVEAHTDLPSHTYVHANNTQRGITLTYTATDLPADLGWGYNKAAVVLNYSHPLTFTTTIQAFTRIVIAVDGTQSYAMNDLSAGWAWNDAAKELTWNGVAAAVNLTAATQTYFTVSTITFTKIDPATTLELYDTAEDIEATLAPWAASAASTDVTIHRTLYKDGYFNTLCLPFSLSASDVATYFEGCELYAFESAVVNAGLDLYIAETDAIEAGKPYLIRWASGDNITEQTFNNVTIEAAQGQALGKGVQFVGAVGRAQLEMDNQNYLFIGANNTVYWPNTSNKMKAFRAYFLVSGSVAPHGAPARLVIRKLPTDIEQCTMDNVQCTKVLRDGELIIIKEGKEYNAQGFNIK